MIALEQPFTRQHRRIGLVASVIHLVMFMTAVSTVASQDVHLILNSSQRLAAGLPSNQHGDPSIEYVLVIPIMIERP